MSASTAPDDAVDRARHPVPGTADTVVLDVDGTLVDSVFHHVNAWDHAFAEVGVEVPLWRLHRAIGMGGDRFVAAVAGDAVEEGVGDVLRAAHDAAYERLFRSVRLLPGADSLITRLHEQGWRVAVASSGTAEQTDAALSLVADAHRADGVVSSVDVDLSKPAPDLARAAVDAAGGESAVLVGDAVWDVRTAIELGAPCLGLLTGGVSRAELADAGAFAVVEGAGDVPEALAGLAPRATGSAAGTGRAGVTGA